MRQYFQLLFYQRRKRHAFQLSAVLPSQSHVDPSVLHWQPSSPTNNKNHAAFINMKTIHSLLCLLAALFVSQTEAFVSRAAVVSRSPAPVSPVALQERRWNFNDGQSPWGMKKNAEIWNGRFAQVSCVALQCKS